MSLGSHLRELRTRVLVVAVAVLLGAIGGWFLYDPITQALMDPLLELSGPDGAALVTMNFGGITTPFAIQLKVAIITGIVLSSPIWIWQVWRFLVPGMRRNERRTALWFMAGAIPLFLAGCALAAWALPRTIAILLSFTPENATALQNAGEYLDFILMFMLAFGLAFLVPVALVALNTLRILPARMMLRSWRVAVMLILVFAALMTPDPSAWTMLALAAPVIALFFAAVGVSFLLERRRAKRDPEWAGLDPDQAGPAPEASTLESRTGADEARREPDPR